MPTHIPISTYTFWSNTDGYHVRDTNSQCTPAIDSLGLDGSDRCPAYRRRCHELPCKVSSTHRCSGPVPMQLAMELILTCLMPVEATPEELLCFVRGRGTPATSTSASRCFCELGDMSVSRLGTIIRTTSLVSFTFTLYRALEAADRAVGAHRANLPLIPVWLAGSAHGARKAW